MDIPTIINHNYYVVRAIKTNRAWICEAERFDDKENKLYYYYGTYELGSDEHKNNHYLSNSYYDILPSENDEVRLATPEEIDILMDILEKNGVVTTLQETKDKMKNVLAELLEHIKTTPKEELEKEFNELEEWSNVGPTVEEFMDFCNKVNKKPKYPKTYEECCEVLGIETDLWFVYEDIDDNHINPACISNYRMRRLDLYHNLEKLLICRDAYWKIAGEQMGLGKPWNPDWKHLNRKSYCIYNSKNNIVKNVIYAENKILAFPTAEMRDAFYENFKDLIEQCKELL